MENQLSLYNTLYSRFNQRLYPQVQTKSTLRVLSHALEEEVLQQELKPVIFTSFQDVRYYQYEQARYETLRKKARAVALFGRQISAPVTFEKEWFVIINEPRFKALMVCQETSPAEVVSTPENKLAESARAFEGVWSYDPEIVNEACRFLAVHADQTVAEAVNEVISQPHQIPTQLQCVLSVSDRILQEMEASNRRTIAQLECNHALLRDLERQAEMLAQVDNARMLAENERNTLHTELRRLYAELTRSQTLMTQAIIDKARLEQNVQAGGFLLQQLHELTLKLEPSPETAQMLSILNSLFTIGKKVGQN